MKSRIQTVYANLQESLLRMKEALEWMALFEHEQQQGSKFSWNSLENAEKQLVHEVGIFHQHFQEMTDLVAKQRGIARKRWERDLERVRKTFQRLVLQSNGHMAAPKSL